MPPWNDSSEAMLMIFPEPCASIFLPAYWLMRKTLLRLVSMTVFQNSSECSAADGACVLHKNVDRSEGADRLIDEACADRLVANIANHGDVFDACLFNSFDGRFQNIVVAMEGNVGAGLRKGDSYARAKTLRAR